MEGVDYTSDQETGLIWPSLKPASLFINLNYVLPAAYQYTCYPHLLKQGSARRGPQTQGE